MSEPYEPELEVPEPKSDPPYEPAEPEARWPDVVEPSETQQATIVGSPPRIGYPERLLTMALTYRAEGAVRQAMSLFFELVEDHTGTAAAGQAVESLLAIASEFEAAGEFRQAQSIYRRVEINVIGD